MLMEQPAWRQYAFLLAIADRPTAEALAAQIDSDPRLPGQWRELLKGIADARIHVLELLGERWIQRCPACGQEGDYHACTVDDDEVDP